jgi:hypothetical protein
MGLVDSYDVQYDYILYKARIGKSYILYDVTAEHAVYRI